MNYQAGQPLYDIRKTWEYNYDRGPHFAGPYPPLPKKREWTFLGKKVMSPVGVAAGPLPNARWLITFIKLGYGSVIQKTVRSSAHEPHPTPNVLFVNVEGKLDLDPEKPIVGSQDGRVNIAKLSITNSFGNPCRSPKVWMDETRKTRNAIKSGQIFGVSVYGTAQENMSLEELADDYAKTARMAKQAGAMFIEANLACPNVKGAENPFLYKDAEAVGKIAKAIKKQIGKTPLLLKIGYFDKYQNLLATLKAAKGNFDGVSAINTISKKIINKKGKQALPGREVSGVCGFAIKRYGIKMVKDLVKAQKQLGLKFEIIGVGGAMTAKDITDYLKAGANHVQSATAVMWNPYLAHELNEYLKQKILK